MLLLSDNISIFKINFYHLTMDSKYKSFSPTEFRYHVKDLEEYLSEDAFTHYKALVELALIKTLAKYGICNEDAVKKMEEVIGHITTEEVYEEEERIRHDIRALVNTIRKYLPDDVKRFVHLTATSYDIIENARIRMYKDAVYDVILPDMIELERTWIDLALREKDTVQIGRTHGQHAVPITFGFTMAEYVNRWGDRILKVKEATDNLRGKFSGAVGAYNSQSLLIDDPEQFEKDLLAELGIEPVEISTQILPHEQMTDFMHSIISAWGVLANFSDDMRHLQRTEIGEVGEPFEKVQVGSSTMPHKKNPITFENVKSAWATFMPRMITAFENQISEHQRDLTNSMSQRYYPEVLVIFDRSVRSINKVSKKLQVDKGNIKKNFELSKDKIVAEPLQILLSYYGHPNAHEKIRQLSMKSYETGTPLNELVLSDKELEPYLKRFTEKQLEIITDPSKYIGVASKKTEEVCNLWSERIKGLEDELNS